eukprot:3937922-Rhodomonas_salina.1
MAWRRHPTRRLLVRLRAATESGLDCWSRRVEARTLGEARKKRTSRRAAGRGRKRALGEQRGRR